MLVNRSTNTPEVRQENLLRLLLCRKAAELSPFSIGILFELAFCEIQHVRVRRTARLAARRSEWQAPCIAGAAMALAAFARLVSCPHGTTSPVTAGFLSATLLKRRLRIRLCVMEPPGGVVKEPFELGRCCAAAVLVFALH